MNQEPARDDSARDDSARDPAWLTAVLLLLIAGLAAACFAGGGWLIASGGWQAVAFGLVLCVVFGGGFVLLLVRAVRVGVRDGAWWR